MKGARILLWTMYTLPAIAGLCLLGLVAALNTETASHRLLRYVAGSAGVEIGDMSGTLARGVELKNISYSKGSADLRIDKFAFDWQPLALLYGSAGFRALRVDGVRVEYVPRPAAGKQKAGLPDLSLPLRIAVSDADLYNLRVNYGGREFALDHIHLDGALGSTLRLNRLTVQAPGYELSAQGAVDGAFPYEGELALEWRYRLENRGIEFAGAADITGDLTRLEAEHRLTAPVELATAGRIVTGLGGDDLPRAELRNRWRGARLQPPLVPFPIDTAGELQITGWLEDYRLRGQGKAAVESEQVPSFRFTLEAGGGLAGLDDAELELETLDGTIAANGSVQWSPRFEWNADIATENLDFRRYHSQAPSGLRLSFHTEGGRTADAHWRMEFGNIQGAGQTGAYPLRLEGGLAFDNGGFSSPSLTLKVAENSLALGGQVNRRLDVRWTLAAPGLPALWPGLEGALNAGGRITGSRDSPRLQAELSGRNLAYGDYRAGRVDAVLRAEKGPEHVLRLQAEQVTVRGRTLSTVNLNARGDAAKHLVEGRIQDDYLEASAAVQGGYRDSRWQGTLRSADWRPGSLPSWSLQKPVEITAGSGRIRTGEACWSAGQARLCTQLAAGGGDIGIEASLASVPAGLLEPWLPAPVDIEGEIGGALSVSGPDWRRLTGNLELAAPAGWIMVRREDMPPDRYPWRNARLDARLRNGGLTATAGLSFPEYGVVESEVAADLDNRSLHGDISARFDNLAPLQTVIPYLDELQGSLQATVHLGGTINQPLFSGSLRLQDASARIPQLGIRINNLGFSARSGNGSDITFEGRAESGGGHLEVTGTLDNGGGAPRLEAAVTGEAFQILRQPQVQARVSPQLDIRAGPERISIQGLVRIPSAQVEILEPPESIVAVSEDAIIVNGAGGSAARPDSGRKLTVQVRLILGDDVRFQGFGFNAGLAGELRLDKTPARPVATTGELRVEEGQYKAFGQKLDIDRGRLLFQGPYDNPGLDILAVRKTPDVTVSLEIGGTLDSPRSRVFSEPPLPDSEAMAILLTGKPLGSASETDANALVNAVAGLGLRKGQFITDEIARAFSLDEFRIKTESDVTASSLFIGKQISPRLFIRYIVGLFDQTSRIGLSYRLSRHLRLEAESGWNQSMDLIYEIER